MRISTGFARAEAMPCPAVSAMATEKSSWTESCLPMHPATRHHHPPAGFSSRRSFSPPRLRRAMAMVMTRRGGSASIALRISPNGTLPANQLRSQGREMVRQRVSRIIVRPSVTRPRTALLAAGALRLRVAIGRTGMTHDKREGDGASPMGRFRLHGLWLRPGVRLAAICGLPSRVTRSGDLWCDASGHRLYNRPARAPLAASHEEMLLAGRALRPRHRDRLEPEAAHHGTRQRHFPASGAGRA